jgi:hypothetical protein
MPYWLSRVVYMAAQIPGPGKQFVLGVVYAVLQLDGVFDRSSEKRLEYGDCEVLTLTSGGFEVVYKTSFPLP